VSGLIQTGETLASQKRIIYLPTHSFYQVLSADAYSKHGFNVSGVIFDELHTQPNRKLFDVMTKGSGDARTQPLYFLITTAGTDTHSICYETHQKALDIIAGRKIDATFYPVIYGAKDTDDWTDVKVWKKANPSLGITVGMDKVKAACESARQNPAEENAFRQLRLNQWVKQAIRWMPMDKWDACAFPVQPDELKGRVCYGGLDLSSTTDITAFVLVFPPQDEADNYVVLPYFWIPEKTCRFVSGGIMSLMTYGRSRDSCTQRKETSSITATSKSLSKPWANSTTSARSPLTAGVRCRWCRTSRVWDLPSSRSGRGSRI
jgi:phage terminase large subunit-like protein